MTAKKKVQVTVAVIGGKTKKVLVRPDQTYADISSALGLQNYRFFSAKDGSILELQSTVKETKVSAFPNVKGG